MARKMDVSVEEAAAIFDEGNRFGDSAKKLGALIEAAQTVIEQLEIYYDDSWRVREARDYLRAAVKAALP